MKISRHIYDLYSRLVLPALIGVLAVSCVSDEGLCPEDRPGFIDGNDVWLSLEVKNQGVTGIDRAASRAGNISDPDAAGHPSEEATMAENYINSSDLTLVLFDKNGRMMKTLSNEDLTLTTLNETTNGSYRVVAKVNRAYFDFASGSMSILAVANSHGINAGLSADDYKAVPWQISLGELTAQLRNFQYNGLTTNSATGTPWLPNKDAGRHIPMAGYEKGIILNADTLAKLDNATTPATAFELPEIVMQRSMAKIRVLDGVQEQSGLRYFTKIENVEFLNGTEYGAIVPDVIRSEMAGWETNGTSIVESATKPTPFDSWHNNSFVFPFSSQGVFDYTDDKETTHSLAQWICYTPEMQVKNLTGFTNEQKPQLRITTQTYEKNNHNTAVGDPKPHTIYLDEIIDRSDIVRNHIYQFYVTMNEFSAELEVNVLDWDKNEETWDYTENPGLDNDGYLRWSGFQSISNSTATGYFNVDYTQSATGTFTIKTPLGGTWRASLITLSGEQNAFVFIDEDGKEVESISGFIDGGQASIKVRPKNAAGSETNSARVQFTVTTVDNRTMIINMLDGNTYGSEKQFFTIVQNPSL